MAPLCDVIIVVGSANSSNSVRLVEVARQAGAERSFRVDEATEIDPAWLAGASTVGLTSGASVPEDLVDDAVAHLVASGFTSVHEIRTATEGLSFALPRELRASAEHPSQGEG
jgi:4-hydroxy-3-methylbut-2-enyl diphosphate reductase